MTLALYEKLESLNAAVTTCYQCPRLRNYCEALGRTKRKAYREQTYWAKPVPGFGDPKAQLILVGLAPSAHGANRTGRMFTGDRSGDWLYQGLFESGFANQALATGCHDGLMLKNAYVTCTVKCAPPQNQPTPEEQRHCRRFLSNEFQLLQNAIIWVAFGQLAFRELWSLLAPPDQKRPDFEHGLKIEIQPGLWLLVSYHPSQQNTFTGKLTKPMFDEIFVAAQKILQILNEKKTSGL